MILLQMSPDSSDTPSGLPQAGRRARLLRWLDADLVVDVGANRGQYARALRQSGYRGPIVSFEPLTPAYESLAAAAADDPLWTCHNVALGSRPETLELNIAADSGCSSFLPIAKRSSEMEAGARYVGRESVQVRRLDAVWNDVAGVARRAYLKIDVQGYELEALTGAGPILGAIRAVEIELSLVEMYEGMTLAGDVIAALARHHLRLAAAECIHDDPATGEMLQLDAVFVRQ